MKANRRPWTPEEHRLFTETFFNGLAQIIAASAKPLGWLALILVLLTGQTEKLIQGVLRLF